MRIFSTPSNASRRLRCFSSTGASESVVRAVHVTRRIEDGIVARGRMLAGRGEVVVSAVASENLDVPLAHHAELVGDLHQLVERVAALRAHLAADTLTEADVTGRGEIRVILGEHLVPARAGHRLRARRDDDAHGAPVAGVVGAVEPEQLATDPVSTPGSSNFVEGTSSGSSLFRLFSRATNSHQRSPSSCAG